MAKPISVLVADDEEPARQGLRDLIDLHSDLQVVAETGTVAETVAAIRALTPDIVFLDIQMPEGNGFDVIRTIGATQMPLVIFATAHDEYAISAFEAEALDYLLKPYDPSRFERALERARTLLRRPVAETGARLDAFLGQLEARSGYVKRLPIRVGERSRLLDVSEIECIESEANYVRVHTARGSHLVRQTLNALEQRLDPARLLRVHRRLIVAVHKVSEVEPLRSGELILYLQSGRTITTGRTYRESIRQVLDLDA